MDSTIHAVQQHFTKDRYTDTSSIVYSTQYFVDYRGLHIDFVSIKSSGYSKALSKLLWIINSVCPKQFWVNLYEYCTMYTVVHCTSSSVQVIQ